jgi:hypothetical protein
MCLVCIDNLTTILPSVNLLLPILRLAPSTARLHGTARVLLSAEIEHLPPISGKCCILQCVVAHRVIAVDNMASCLLCFQHVFIKSFGLYGQVIYCYDSSCDCSKQSISTMARAQSKLKVRYKESQAHEKHILAAVELYLKSRNDALLNNNKVPSYAEVMCMCNVPKETLRRRIAGLPSRLDVAAKRGWLNHAESQELIDHILMCADQGFPIGRKDIERHALEIARIGHPDLAALGPSWVDRFIARNQDQLWMHWTANLDHSRVAGVNPTAVHHWFELVASAFQAYNFAPENVYGFDESGFPFGGDSARQRVVSRTDVQIQHVQRGGNRENVTVMVTICADGTTMRPTVIFKGKRMFSDWTRANVATMRYIIQLTDRTHLN